MIIVVMLVRSRGKLKRNRILQIRPDRFAVGQNVATTWTFQRMPPNKDTPEYKRHIMGWFDEVLGKLQIYSQSATNLYLKVYKYKWRSRDIEPFMFRMDTGHYTQVGRSR